MGPVPWTRLEGTALWTEARAAYALPPGRTYHGFGHVLRLYAHAAQTFDLPYDAALIEGPGAEARSRTWLLARKDLVQLAWSRFGTTGEPLDDVLDRAGAYILATERHRPTLSTAPMVLLDLADFLDEAASRANTAALFQEARALKHCDEATWTEQTRSYLVGLSASLAHGLRTAEQGAPEPALPPALREQIRAVRAGVDRVADALRRAPEPGRAG
jgi:hypothetical protein